MIILMLKMIYGNDEQLVEQRIQEIIQGVIEFQNSEDRDYFVDMTPIQMQNGRETNLNLANIIIYDYHSKTDSENAIYQYLKNEKFEDLKLYRLEQLKKITQNNSDFYSLEKYLEEYENQSGNKLSELQLEGIRNFDKKIQEDVIIGKYNLEDYSTFLKSIPDLLSRKKALAIGRFNQEGYFIFTDEIYEKMPDVKDFTTYTYHRLNKGENRFAKENFEISLPSIRKRMWPKPNKSKSKLCCIDLNNVNQDTRYSELDKPRPVKVHEVEEHPNIKIVGKR